MTLNAGSFNLQEMQCPSCGAPHMGVVDGKRLTCTYCGADFVIAETVCPQCGNINEPGTDYCIRCGGEISRACIACGTRNWANAEWCEHCGRELDVIADMSTRWANRTSARLSEQMSSASKIKRHEAEAADARSAALWEMERQRQEQLQRSLERRRAQEQRIVYFAVAAIGIMILLVVLIIAMQSAG